MPKNFNLPSLVFTPEQCKKIENSPTIITKEAGDQLIVNILAQGLIFHSKLWSEDLKDRAKNIRYMKKHPEEFRAREKIAHAFYFGCSRRKRKRSLVTPEISLRAK